MNILEMLHNLISRMELRGILKGCTIQVTQEYYGIVFRSRLKVPCVHSGATTIVYSADTLLPSMETHVAGMAEPEAKRFLYDWVRRQLRQSLEHELDEAIWVDGKCVEDPHVRENVLNSGESYHRDQVLRMAL